MRRMWLWMGIIATMAMPASAWRPSGWVYFNGPYVYDHAAQDWYWLSPNNVQWANGFPPANGWRPMNQSALAQGWSWHAWPYAYSHANGAWYFFSANGRQKCINLRTGVWSVFGVPAAGNYLVIDLSAGPDATAYPVSFLPAAPTGGWTDEYKTTKLVLRRVPAGVFTMGSPANELERQVDETQHRVTITRDFYVGVFEVTQKQWERVMGTWPGFFEAVAHRDARPVEEVSYNTIRGAGAGSGWPANNQVDPNSFMGRLRARTGRALDLPTEAQWEYACRAGTTSALNSGKNLTDASECPNLAQVGRYWYNGGIGFSTLSDPSKGTAKAGSHLPNNWGLYDFHGNVWEWCLDWYGDYPGAATDPRGPAGDTYRVIRGGGWHHASNACRSAYRDKDPPDYQRYYTGFRVMAPTDPF
jgi:formylglycine-generating enzyme required for sulfatase activity